jgi:hypothetical protein
MVTKTTHHCCHVWFMFGSIFPYPQIPIPNLSMYNFLHYLQFFLHYNMFLYSRVIIHIIYNKMMKMSRVTLQTFRSWSHSGFHHSILTATNNKLFSLGVDNAFDHLWHGLPSHNGLLRPATPHAFSDCYTADVDSALPVCT